MKGNVSLLYKFRQAPKIIGVLGFDAPYFGLSDSITNFGTQKIKSQVKSATNYVSSLFSSSTSSSSSTPRSENSTSKWKILSGVVLGTVAIGVGTSVLKKNPVLRDTLLEKGQEIWNEGEKKLTDYLNFLKPLIENNEQNKRIDDLITTNENNFDTGGKVLFRNYYPITYIKDEDDDFELEKNTFIKIPNESKYKKYFISIPCATNSTNVVFSHTKIFNSEVNKKNLELLVENCSMLIINNFFIN